ncbi:cupin domain-containing protein [Flavobacterium silvaticum]|uniref:Quercetin 2,3-dioxygenase C-terminal cupin domain-containing protein n=1 Tax=Flavobacterium silvaticum TaxID=1852020 RepID=A0A972FMG1_9FLAO|nr:hypothetical protein [Flavobacterium silvaticum]NMH28428.1 hypothetical protein [Flavobacterium silvaticum]
MEQTARIFLSTRRETEETEIYRKQSLFADSGIGDFRQLSDEVLAADTSKNYNAEPFATLIFPLIGNLEFESESHQITLMTGNVLIIPADTVYIIRNFYDDLQVNFLQIKLSVSLVFEQIPLEPLRNQLQVIAEFPGIKLSLGIYDGRQKAEIETKSSLLAFVINGAFEFQDRLLETRDGLFLEGFGAIDYESLSGDAVILLAEILK